MSPDGTLCSLAYSQTDFLPLQLSLTGLVFVLGLVSFGGDGLAQELASTVVAALRLLLRWLLWRRNFQRILVVSPIPYRNIACSICWRFYMALYQRVRGNRRVFSELNNLTSRDRSEDEMFLNGTVNRRSEFFGRTALFGIAFGF